MFSVNFHLLYFCLLKGAECVWLLKGAECVWLLKEAESISLNHVLKGGKREPSA